MFTEVCGLPRGPYSEKSPEGLWEQGCSSQGGGAWLLFLLACVHPHAAQTFCEGPGGKYLRLEGQHAAFQFLPW